MYLNSGRSGSIIEHLELDLEFYAIPKTHLLGLEMLAFILDIQATVSQKNQGFASDWDYQNMDFPDFWIFWPSKMTSTCRNQEA